VATPPADSPIGTTITAPGEALYVGGQAYEITAAGEIQITPWQGAPYIVTSSSNVVSITVVAKTASNPTGLQQINKAGQIWTVAAINVAGSYVGQAPSSSSSTPSGSATITATIPPSVPGRGALTLSIEAAKGDWAKLDITATGDATGWANSIPPGENRSLNGGTEAEYYANANLQTPGGPFSINAAGQMVITASPCDPSSNPLGKTYQSGCLTNQTSFGQKYGFHEFRAKVPPSGFWSAGWMLSQSNVYDGENDLMESGWAGDNNNDVHQTVHGVLASTGQWTSNYVNPSVPNVDADFHVFACDWTAETVTYYVDGVQTGQFPTPVGMNEPYYWLFDLAVGAPNSWVGAPTSGTSGEFIIDYVHSYAS